MKLAILAIAMFFLLTARAWSQNEVSAQFLVHSSRINGTPLVLGRVQKLVKPSGFTYADPPRGTILIEKVYSGKASLGALDVVFRPPFDIMVPDTRRMTEEQRDKKRLIELSKMPMPAPPLNKPFFIQIASGLEKLPLVTLFPYNQEKSDAIRDAVEKFQAERDIPKEAQRIVQSACTSGQGLLRAKVVRLEKEFGCNCSHLPSGVVQVEKVYLGKYGPGQLSVTWDDFEQCKNRNCPVGVPFEEREYESKQRARIPVPCPPIGEVQLLLVRPSINGLTAAALDFEEGLTSQISTYVTQLRNERDLHNQHWDQLPYDQLVRESSDIVVAKLINQYEVKILQRLKDSASAAGRSVSRPLYLLPDVKFPVPSKPFDGEVICFLNAGPDCSGWSPTPTNQGLGTRAYTAPRETYERMMFRYKPVRKSDWCVPVTTARLDAVKKALSTTSYQQPAPRNSDRVVEFVELYYGLNRVPMDAAKIGRLMELADAIVPKESIYYRNCVNKAIQFYTKSSNESEVNRLRLVLKNVNDAIARQNLNYVVEPLAYWAYLDD